MPNPSSLFQQAEKGPADPLPGRRSREPRSREPSKEPSERARSPAPAWQSDAEPVSDLRCLLEQHHSLLDERFQVLMQRQNLILARLEGSHMERLAMEKHGMRAGLPAAAQLPLAGGPKSASQEPTPPPPPPRRAPLSQLSHKAKAAHREAQKVKDAFSDKTEAVGILSKAYRSRVGFAKHSVRASSSSGGSSGRASVRTSKRSSAPEELPPVTPLLRPETPQRQWRELLSRDFLFDFMASSMIVGNALLMGAETEYTTFHEGQSHAYFLFAQVGLNVWFIFELLVRIVKDKCRFFSSADFRWHLFDACLVAFSLVDLVQVAQVGFAKSVSSTGRLMRIIRLARVLRLARLCRNLNHVHQFRKMVYCLQASMSTLGWALLLLVTVMYAFAILFVQGVAEHMGGDAVANVGAELAQQLTENYGGMQRALSTLYKAVTGGQSWTEFIEPLGELEGSFSALFLVYISIVFFGVLNVVTAVFVESAMDSAAHYKDLRIYESRKSKEALVSHMRQVFAQIDTDGSGSVTYQEMDQFLNDPQCRMYVESLEVTVEDTMMLFHLMDLNDSGHVDIEEFCNGLLRLQGDAKSFDVHLLIFEMAKLQSKWDSLVSYIGLKFDEVVSMAADMANPGSASEEEGGCAAGARRGNGSLFGGSDALFSEKPSRRPSLRSTVS